MNTIRLLNKRNKNIKLDDDCIVIDIDRSNPMFGNPILLNNKDDAEERASVLVEYTEYFNKRFDNDPEFRTAIYELVKLVRQGKKLCLSCWCHPLQCHGDVIISKVQSLVGNAMIRSKKEMTAFLEEIYKPEDIDYVECRFACHIPKSSMRNHDWHMVKEAIHLKDGTVVPYMRYLKNYKRPFWTTSPRFRGSYSQKREWEYLDRLVEGSSVESDLPFEVARALGNLSLARNPIKLKDSPHIYGLDIPSTVVIKEEYVAKKEGKPDTPYSIGYSDTETNMLGLEQGASKHIIMQSLFFGDKLYTVILKDFLATVPDPQVTLREMYDQHMPEQGKKMVAEWEIDIVDKPIDIVKLILKRCHNLQPDFLSFWNMIFDLDKMIECVEEAGYRVEDIFCDPRLPAEMRYYYLKRANPTKTSASGRMISKQPSEQWHSFHCPASFYIIDQMATYRFIRKGGQKDDSYSLDAILKKECKGLGKLKHAPAEGLEGAGFHILMQQTYPAEYCIYHAWDTVCMQVLNGVTKDLDYSLPGSTEISDFMSFESEPKRYMHKFHYYMLKKHGAVSGVSGKSLVQEYDEMTISTRGHIVALEPHLTVASGLNIFKDYPGLRTNQYGQAADLDVKSSYPYGQWLFGVSRMTTVRELIDIEGVSEEERRMQGLNLSGGSTNAIEFCTQIYKMPTLVQLGRYYDQRQAA